jgi:hypothetical protein
MTGLIVTCARCGTSYEPTSERIRAGAWRLCPACANRPAAEPETRCRECGRELRNTGTRDLCLSCALGGLSP